MPAAPPSPAPRPNRINPARQNGVLRRDECANPAQLFAVFLLLGVSAFGGQPALLALLTRELCDKRAWATEATITEAFTYSKLLPGPVVVQVVAFLGQRLGGATGTLAATTAFLAPSVGVMLLLGATYTRIATDAGVRAALAGLTAAVVGIIVVGTWAQARKSITDAQSGIVALFVCAATLLWNTNPALLVLCAGLWGVWRELRAPAPETDTAP